MRRLAVGFAVWLGLFSVGQARVLVVVVTGGDEMFSRSAWIRQALPTGAAGWLVPTAHHTPWTPPPWSPDLTLLDVYPTNPTSQTFRAGAKSHMPPLNPRFLPLVPDGGMAFGVRASPEALPARWRQDIRQARWVDVQLDEVARALRYAEFCTPEQAERLQQRAWQQIDRWLVFLTGMYDPRHDLVIVVGSALEEGEPWAIWLRGKGVGKGWLWDGSVRVQGAGQTLSLLTTVRAALGLPVSPAWGDRLHGEGSPPSAKMLTAQRAAWQMRHPLWQGALWIRAAWIGLAFMGLVWAYRAGRERRQRAVVRLRVVGQPSRSPRTPPPVSPSPTRHSPLTLFAPATWGLWGVALGVASLFPAALPASAVWSAPLIVLLATGLLFWLARALDAPLVGLGAIAGLGLIALVLDTLSGGDWNRDGLFGHTLLGGYRFYGVGNQYAALALSWALILCAVWLRIEGLPLGALCFFALFALWMGWQSSNVGATLATVGALMVFGIPLLRDQLRGQSRRVQMAYALGLLGIVGLSLALLWLNTPHLRGFWTGAFGMADMSAPSDLVLRKALINLGESLLSLWTILLVGSLLAVRWLHPVAS
ncbi:MAG: hypothetical protein NZL85_09855, partial [Fimbriimonadales bacterium]|nr:hypothetical protein [Fimbriimonadales bacterium]